MKQILWFLAALLGAICPALAQIAPPSYPAIILTPGSTPGSLTNGELWTTSSGLFARINGGTVGPFGSAAGTVTSVSNPSIFGVTCSVATATTTPAITCAAGTSLVLGTPASGTLTNLTGLPISTGLTGAGTGVLAALGINIGSAGAPVLFNGALGTPSSGTLTSATGLPISTGVSGLGTGVATAAAANLSAAGGLSKTIGSGTATLGTSAISSAACATVVTVSMPGTLTTDVISWGFNGNPTAVTGYVPLVAGMLTIIAYPSADSGNFLVCNNTNGSITPGAITLNTRVMR